MPAQNFTIFTGLSVGNVTVNATTNSITTSGNISSGNLTVSQISNLGNVSNLRISGGTSGYVLSTDGTGNLSWIEPVNQPGIIAREVQVATNDQTVFNLANISYAAGTNSLGVFIDGVRQFPSAYTETSNTAVTFSSPLTANQSVLFEATSNTASVLSTVAVQSLTVSASANLGSVTNLTITGGQSGQILTSLGNGSVDWQNTVNGYSVQVGNGVANIFAVEHNLNVGNVFVTVLDQTSGYIVTANVQVTTANSVIVRFDSVPTVNQYKVSVMGF
jgi:hypothetical protein